MIDRDEIDAMSETLEVHASDVQRDYVFGWLLAALYGEQLIPDGYVLKGGSCLRKGYFERTRFTRDLDFSLGDSARLDDLEAALNEACKSISTASGVNFDLDRTFVRKKKRVSEDLSVYEGAVYFSDFYGKQSHVVVSARMDVTEFDRLHLAPAERPLLHPYSDAASCEATIRCAQLEEVLASKLKCLLQRRHVADLYDLSHWIFFHGDDLDRRAILQVLRNLAFDAFGGVWERYISCAKDGLMPFTDAVDKFVEMVGSLFGNPRGWGRGIFFPSKLRNPLLEAGSGPKRVRLTYKGVSRIAEPYSLRFKHTKDGTAREYLYAFEVSKAGRPTGTMKTYVADPMTAVEVLDEKFEPDYAVELSSAGEDGPKRDFDRASRLPRAYAPRPRRSSKKGGGIKHVIRCPNCRKLFYRKERDLTLKRHKDPQGHPCSGRWGIHEGTR